MPLCANCDQLGTHIGVDVHGRPYRYCAACFAWIQRFQPITLVRIELAQALAGRTE